MTKRTIKGTAELPPPWDTAEFEPADIGAIKALIDGRAEPHQQQRVVVWLRKATGMDSLAFRPGGEDGRRSTDFAEGKRFVGLQFFTLARAVLPPQGEASNAAP